MEVKPREYRRNAHLRIYQTIISTMYYTAEINGVIIGRILKIHDAYYMIDWMRCSLWIYEWHQCCCIYFIHQNKLLKLIFYILSLTEASLQWLVMRRASQVIHFVDEIDPHVILHNLVSHSLHWHFYMVWGKNFTWNHLLYPPSTIFSPSIESLMFGLQWKRTNPTN